MFGRGIIVMIGLGLLNFTVAASTVHKLRFSQPAKVLVWQSGEFIGQGREVSVLARRGEGRPNVIGSGQLLAAHSDVPETQRIEFSVASNSGFVIKSDDPRFADDAQVRIIGVGANAASAVAHADRSTGEIYLQSSKTAQRPGTPKTQAVHFEVSWTSETPPDLEVVAFAP